METELSPTELELQSYEAHVASLKGIVGVVEQARKSVNPNWIFASGLWDHDRYYYRFLKPQ